MQCRKVASKKKPGGGKLAWMLHKYNSRFPLPFQKAILRRDSVFLSIVEEEFQHQVKTGNFKILHFYSHLTD